MKRGAYKRVVPGNTSGPGGIKCPCCRPAGCGKKDAQKVAHKAVRRESRRVIKEQLKD